MPARPKSPRRTRPTRTRPTRTAGRRAAGALLLAVLLTWACGPEAAPAPPTATSAEAAALPLPLPFDPADLEGLEAWRARRDQGLRAEDGYLSLVALTWLQPGSQLLGADPAAPIELPAGLAPPRLGTLTVTGDAVSFAAEPGVEVLRDGEPLGAEPVPMLYGDDTTELASGELTFWVIERAGQLGLRAASPHSPVRAAFRGNAVYPASGAWRLPARFVPFDQPQPLPTPNVLGSTYADVAPGRLEFVHDGTPYTLWPSGDPATGLSLIFGDTTNGEGSYGGGRFLSVPPPDEQGVTWLDFNRAYNPPCNYSPYTTCPLPPPANRLPFAVEAGERRYDTTPPRVLLLTQSAGYVHDVVRRPADDVPSLVEAALQAAATPRFELTLCRDASTLSADELARYDALVLYTTGELPLPDPGALVEFVRAGGGLLGLHCATDTLYQQPDYQAMLGGVFDGHPWHGPVRLEVEQPRHPATQGLPAVWAVTDEIYQFRDFERGEVEVLLSLDTASVEAAKGGRADGDYALAWCRDFGAGRVCYSALGHEAALWRDPVFVEHVLGGLAWVTGAGAGQRTQRAR